MTTNHKKIAIIGPYGSGNLGDEAMLASIIKKFRSNGFQKLYVVGINHRFLSKEIRHNGGFEFISYFNLPKLFMVLRTVDWIIFGSGCLLKTVSALKLLPVFILTYFMKKMFLFFGIEVYPMPKSLSYILFKLLNNSGLWVVRTDLSKKILIRNGIDGSKIMIVPDVAHLFRLHRKTRNMVDAPIVGINVRPPMIPDWFDKNSYKNLVIYLVSLILSNLKNQVWFIPMHPKDELFAQEIVNSLNHTSNSVKILKYEPSLSNLLNTLRMADIFIGMRLHSLIFAKLLGLKTIAIPYSLKTFIYANDNHIPMVLPKKNEIKILLPSKNARRTMVEKEYLDKAFRRLFKTVVAT